MKRKICFITGTRADYGIMAPVMKEVEKSPSACLQIIATNMHLSPDFGKTIAEIEADGFKVDEKVESLVENGSAKGTVRSMAKELDGLAEAFGKLKPDMIVILGDRYEALAAAGAAVTFNIPIAHLHGGEITEGAIDDKFRNAITQMSDLHFASTQEYAQRIISMGKKADTVFHSGAPGAEGKAVEGAGKEFYEKTGLDSSEPFIILAFHPVTTVADRGASELKATLAALDLFLEEGFKILVTLPNSDPGNIVISDMLKNWGSCHEGLVSMVPSLGSRLFHYALDHASAIIGNSSAALIEAPTHRLGAVNVGIRQKGRAHGITVIDTPPDADRILGALKAVVSLEMKSVLMGLSVSSLNPYFKENSACFIADKLINYKI